MIETVATILNGIFIALGVAMFVLLMVSYSFKRETKKLVKRNEKYRYVTIKCDICGMDMWGSSKVSVNKTFYWHIENTHKGAI